MTKKQFFLQEIALFFLSLQKTSNTRIQLLCKESHISTRTYYKIMRQKMVKRECYFRLLIGISRASYDNQFMEQWQKLGNNLFMRYNED